MGSILNDVNILITKRVGDLSRLEHIKETIENNKKLYDSDLKYIDDLTQKHLFSKEIPDNTPKVKQTTIIKEELPQKEEPKDLPTEIPNEIIPQNSFCTNCGNSLENENFCKKCGTKTNNNGSSNSSENTSQPKPQTKNQKTGRKSAMIIFGVFLIVSSAGAFFVPISDNGMSASDMSNLCKGPLGMLGQAFGGEQVKNNCAMINSIVSMATLVLISGLLLTAFGIYKRRK
jgi:hypothetical protein